ncbi:MAG: hypothetical protein V4662_20435 [Verrucomicrobiota bacterium]
MSHHLVQILLPMFDSEGEMLPPDLHEQVKVKLTQEFGGVTAYVHAPAEGRWKQDGREIDDDMAMYEVVTETLDTEWWAQYRTILMGRFQQKDILIRALPTQLL